MPEKPFLITERVEGSLSQLTEEQTLVIYCGAGVTVGRTGLEWNDLVLSVFNQSEEAGNLPPDEFSAVRALLENSSIDPRKKAHLSKILGEYHAVPESLPDIVPVVVLRCKRDRVLDDRLFPFCDCLLDERCHDEVIDSARHVNAPLVEETITKTVKELSRVHLQACQS